MPKPPRFVAIGEVLYDCFEDRREIGGAPANCAAHAAKLGLPTALVSAIGDDDLGREALEQLQLRDVDVSAVQINSLPTGTVDVVLTGGQPDYTINSPAAWDAIEATDEALSLAASAAAVCFGTLACRNEHSRQSIQRIVSHCRSDAIVMLDVNLRRPQIADSIICDNLRLANALKLNEDEVPAVAAAAAVPAERHAFVAGLSQQFGINLVLITYGSRGAWLHRGEEEAWADAVPVQSMASTVGAGDSFTAAAIVALLAGKTLKEVGADAAAVAARTCSHAGGMPPI